MMRRIWLCFMLGIGTAFAEDAVSGFDFLRLDLGGRITGMGGAFGAIAEDIHGIRYNPAALAGMEDKLSSFTFQTHYMDIKSGFAGFTKRFRYGQWAVGLFYLNYGEIQRTDQFANELGTFAPGDILLTFAYADTAGSLRYGAGLKAVQSIIDEYSSFAMAVDLGIQYRWRQRNATFGFSILNLGYNLKPFVEIREKLPITYQLGFSQKLAHLPLLLNVSLLRYQYESSSMALGIYWAVGGEFTIKRNIFFRLGYNSRAQEQKTGSDRDWMAGISLGLGVVFSRFNFDYAYGSHGGLGQQNSFTLTFQL